MGQEQGQRDDNGDDGMTHRTCPLCDTDISLQVKRCQCGYRIVDDPEKQKWIDGLEWCDLDWEMYDGNILVEDEYLVQMEGKEYNQFILYRPQGRFARSFREFVVENLDIPLNTPVNVTVEPSPAGSARGATPNDIDQPSHGDDL